MIMNIWVKDKTNGRIHQVGTDVHDSFEFLNGRVEYYNLQNGDGTGEGGGYEFIEAPDMENYVSLTPDQLWLNRELIHKDILNAIAMRRNGKDLS